MLISSGYCKTVELHAVLCGGSEQVPANRNTSCKGVPSAVTLCRAISMTIVRCCAAEVKASTPHKHTLLSVIVTAPAGDMSVGKDCDYQRAQDASLDDAVTELSNTANDCSQAYAAGVRGQNLFRQSAKTNDNNRAGGHVTPEASATWSLFDKSNTAAKTGCCFAPMGSAPVSHRLLSTVGSQCSHSSSPGFGCYDCHG